MSTLTTILSFLTSLLKALVPIGAFMLGKRSVQRDQLQESVDAARGAKEVQDSIAGMSDAELDSSLHKYTRK